MNVITTAEQLANVVEYYLEQDAFAYDVETVGDRRGDTPINEVLWISLATYGRCDVIPMGHPNGNEVVVSYPLTQLGERRKEQGLTLRPSDYSRDKKKALLTFTEAPPQMYPAEVFKALEPLMFSDILKVGHNLVFDLCSVAKYYNGQVPKFPYFDTMIASFISDNRNKNKCGLDDCLKREFGYEMVKGVGKEVEKHTFDDVARYAYLDAKYTFLLWKRLTKLIEERNLTSVFNIEMEVLEVLCSMKLTGAPIDVQLLSELYETLTKSIRDTKQKIFSLVERPFNINSNLEKQEILYRSKDEGGRGLKPKILTPKGAQKDSNGLALSYTDFSVSAEALEMYRGKDALVDTMLEYADLNKLMSTYVIPYMGGEVVRTIYGKEKREIKESLLINNRIHADFIQHGAETGRFSSRNPNLQNVPAPHTPHGKAIRNLFYAPEGYKLVVADYSQIEPRIIASLSNDPIMINSYLEGNDIYTTVGETVGVDRKAGKVLVLSMAYGAGPDKIAQQIGCTITEARQLLSEFTKKFPAVNEYKVKIVGSVRNSHPPAVKTLFGRLRYLPDVNAADVGLRKAAERQAFNTKIQGSAADIIKVAMVRAHQMIPQQARIILTVHDELVLLTPDNKAEETAEALREAMEGINVLKVPLIADVKIVQRWGEAK